jgi:(p)ppGpp synthase/HD superfamily hydrolase
VNLVEKARVFATAAHCAVGQKRKYTGEDYIVHPEEVASLVKSTRGATDEMIAASWLHDTLEDTQVTYAVLHAEFGLVVADYVLWLSDVSRPQDGNRSYRKMLDRQHIAAAPAEVQSIKVADLISNTRSILAHDKKFAAVYLEEKRQLMDVLTKADADLRYWALAQLDADLRELAQLVHGTAPESQSCLSV